MATESASVRTVYIRLTHLLMCLPVRNADRNVPREELYPMPLSTFLEPRILRARNLAHSRHTVDDAVPVHNPRRRDQELASCEMDDPSASAPNPSLPKFPLTAVLPPHPPQRSDFRIRAATQEKNDRGHRSLSRQN